MGWSRRALAIRGSDYRRVRVLETEIRRTRREGRKSLSDDTALATATGVATDSGRSCDHASRREP